MCHPSLLPPIPPSWPVLSPQHVLGTLNSYCILVCIAASVDAALGRDVVLHGHLVHGCEGDGAQVFVHLLDQSNWFPGMGVVCWTSISQQYVSDVRHLSGGADSAACGCVAMPMS